MLVPMTSPSLTLCNSLAPVILSSNCPRPTSYVRFPLKTPLTTRLQWPVSFLGLSRPSAYKGRFWVSGYFPGCTISSPADEQFYSRSWSPSFGKFSGAICYNLPISCSFFWLPLSDGCWISYIYILIFVPYPLFCPPLVLVSILFSFLIDSLTSFEKLSI